MADVLIAIGVVAGLTAGFGGIVYFGWWLAIAQLRQERSELQAKRGQLDAEWRALDNTRRLREVFLGARRAMQRQAQAQYRRGEDA